MLPAITFFSSGLLIGLTLFALFIIFFVVIPKLRMQAYKQNGVKTYFYPVIGFLRYMEVNFKKYGEIMADAKKLADDTPSDNRFIVSNLTTKLFLILRDPKYIKEFLQNPSLYKKSRILDWSRMFTPNGLVVAEGDIWKRHRRIISNSFHYEFLKDNIGVIQDTAREFLDKIPADGCKDYAAISKIQEITGEVVGRIFFGENLNSYTFEGRSLTIALADITTELALAGRHPLVLLFGIRVLKSPFIPRFRRLIARMNKMFKLCSDIITDRKAKAVQSNDLLAALLATQKSEDPEKRFSDAEIIDEFITFFVAGMDTTGHLIGMILYNLAKHPEHLAELKKERDREYNKSKRATAEDIQKMDILHSFLKETLRFHTPAPLIFARVALVDHKLLDMPIKKGDLVSPELMCSFFDEKSFENPHEFRPERWKTNEMSKADPYVFVPFSAGPRNCIGQHLAVIESKIIISEFLNRFSFKLKEGYELQMNFKFLYEPNMELLLDLSPIKA